jgi:hypothetical protein
MAKALPRLTAACAARPFDAAAIVRRAADLTPPRS